MSSHRSSLPLHHPSHFPGPAGAQGQMHTPAPAPAPHQAGATPYGQQQTQPPPGTGSMPMSSDSPGSSGSEADSRLLQSLREWGACGHAQGMPMTSLMPKSKQGWAEATARAAAGGPVQVEEGLLPEQHAAQPAGGSRSASNGRDHNRRARYGGDSYGPVHWQYSSLGDAAAAASGRKVPMQEQGQQEVPEDSRPLHDQQRCRSSVPGGFKSTRTQEPRGPAMKQHSVEVHLAAAGGSSAPTRVATRFPAAASPTDQAADIHDTRYSEKATSEQGTGIDPPAGRHAPPAAHSRQVHGRAAVMCQATPAPLGCSPLTGAGLAASDQLFAALKARLASLQATLGQE
jgi:hypothetical protein